MASGRLVRIASAAGTSMLLVGASLAGASGVAAAGSTTLYVATGGTSGAADTSCDTAAYATINDAVSAAAAGDTVVVCSGTYKESVAVTKSLVLTGQNATIDATGLDVGIKITASNVTVMGFTVENATGEGILAQQPNPVKGPMIQGTQFYTGAPITHVVIKHNVVMNNNQGGLPANAATTTYAECKPSGQVPGDCGEGIHLWSVANSDVLLNTVTGNMGGILLTDEFGPTHNNLIAGNTVTDNAYDCGITLPGHNLAMDPQTGKMMPTFGGVYDNMVRNNVILDNGLKGEGAGVLVAAPFPGSASYDNTIKSNYIMGNDLAGVTMHSHAPGAFIGGNRVLDNVIGTNNVGGDPDAKVVPTAAIVAWSAATPMHETISGNTLFGNWYGIWTSANITTPGAYSSNTFWTISTYVHKG